MSRDPSIKRVPPAARPAAAAAPSRTAPQSPRPQPQKKKVPQAPPPLDAPLINAPIKKRVFYGTAIARGLALFVAIFSLLNIVIEYRQLGYNANQWWINFNPLYAVLGKPI